MSSTEMSPTRASLAAVCRQITSRLRMNEFVRKTVSENQKDHIRAGYQLILKSSILQRTLDRETLKIVLFRSFAKPRWVQRFDRILAVREVLAGRWGVLTTCDHATQTSPRQHPRFEATPARQCRRQPC